MIQKLLEKIVQQEQSALIKQVDKQRWTPLHCAAYFDCLKSAIMLLKVDRSIAYMKDAKGMTALHINCSPSRPFNGNEIYFRILS